ncbi:MAG: PEP-CTERM sorting domain-containing protein [Acidobacteriaceae bacterium]
MKTIFVIPALVLLFGASTLRADTITATLTTGAMTDILVTTPILNGFQFSYENVTTVIGLGIPPTVSASDSTFLATYVVTGGVGVLNVTDLCAKVDIFTPLAPCQNFAFSFTSLDLGKATVVSVLADTNILVTVGTANFNIAGTSVALGGGTVDFTPGPSPIPEPSSLALVATGLFGAAGLIRKRFSA